jgi:hypothetical protein
MIAAKGVKGDLGPRGPRGVGGDRGATGTPAMIVGWCLDIESYGAYPVLSNGQVGPGLDLRPLFLRCHDETELA